MSQLFSSPWFAPLCTLVGVLITLWFTRGKTKADELKARVDSLLGLINGLEKIGVTWETRANQLATALEAETAEKLELKAEIARLNKRIDELAVDRDRQAENAKRGASERKAILEAQNAIEMKFDIQMSAMAQEIKLLRAAVDQVVSNGSPSKDPLPSENN